jgi:hypothetical protein
MTNLAVRLDEAMRSLLIEHSSCRLIPAPERPLEFNQ